MAKQASSSGAVSHPRVEMILTIFVVAAVFTLVGYYIGSSMGETSTCAPAIRSGAPVHPSKAVDKSSPIVARCKEICSASASVGMNLSAGLCLNNDLNGYACAVVVGDSGHCPSYYAGTPEVVFDTRCRFVGVYSEKGGAK